MIILSKVSQEKKQNKYHMLSLTEMNLYMKHKQTHRQRKQTYTYRTGKGGGQRINYESWISRYMIYTVYETDKQQGPTM